MFDYKFSEETPPRVFVMEKDTFEKSKLINLDEEILVELNEEERIEFIANLLRTMRVGKKNNLQKNF